MTVATNIPRLENNSYRAWFNVAEDPRNRLEVKNQIMRSLMKSPMTELIMKTTISIHRGMSSRCWNTCSIEAT